MEFMHVVRMLPELQRILVEVSLTGHMLCQNKNVSISYVMFFKYCNTLYLLLYPLKQFAGLYPLSFKDISSLLRSAISKSF